MTDTRHPTVTIHTDFDVFQAAVASCRNALAELLPEVEATHADAAGRCALCLKRADQLVRIVENGEDRHAANAGHRICPECASERPTILMPVYAAPDDLDVDCSHLSAFLIVTGQRFGRVGCLRCAVKAVGNADLIARGIDPNRPHGGEPPMYPELVSCYCERCFEFVEPALVERAIRLNMTWEQFTSVRVSS